MRDPYSGVGPGMYAPLRARAMALSPCCGLHTRRCQRWLPPGRQWYTIPPCVVVCPCTRSAQSTWFALIVLGVRIFWCELVSSLAMRLTCIDRAKTATPEVVLFSCDQLEVVGVDTALVSAHMINCHTMGDFSHKLCPSESMCSPALPALCHEVPIASRVQRPCPLPTHPERVYERPEALFVRALRLGDLQTPASQAFVVVGTAKATRLTHALAALYAAFSL